MGELFDRRLQGPGAFLQLVAKAKDLLVNLGDAPLELAQVPRLLVELALEGLHLLADLLEGGIELSLKPWPELLKGLFQPVQPLRKGYRVFVPGQRALVDLGEVRRQALVLLLQAADLPEQGARLFLQGLDRGLQPGDLFLQRFALERPQGGQPSLDGAQANGEILHLSREDVLPFFLEPLPEPVEEQR